jgi:hypothetical protein
MKICPVGAEPLYAEGERNGHEANSRLSQLCERARQRTPLCGVKPSDTHHMSLASNLRYATIFITKQETVVLLRLWGYFRYRDSKSLQHLAKGSLVTLVP